MKRILKWLLLLIAVLVIPVIVLLYNPGVIKGPLERYLSDTTGYSISLNGDLDIDIGRLTALTATDIQVLAPVQSKKPDLVDLGHIKLAVVTSSLFKQNIILDSLRVDALQINLETDAQGQGNWQSAVSPQEKTVKQDPGESKKVILRDVSIINTGLRFYSGKTDRTKHLKVDSFKQKQLSDGMLESDLVGQLNGRPITFTGHLGPYDNLIKGEKVSFDADGNFGELKIRGKGFIDSFLKPQRPVFTIDLEGPDVDEITTMLGVDDLGAGKFSLKAKGTAVNDHYEASIHGRVGDISIDATAKVSELTELHEVDLDLSANGPSLGAFTRAAGIKHWPDKPFNIKTNIDRIGGTLNVSDLTLNIGGTKLSLDALLTDFPNLDAGRANLKIAGDDVTQFHELIGVTGLGTGPFELNGKLDVSAEGVELVRVELDTSLGNATISGTLGDAPAYIGSDLTVHLDGQNAHALTAPFGLTILPEQAFNLNARVEVVENALRIRRGVLQTANNKRVDLDGLLTFESGIAGSDLQLKLNSQGLAEDLAPLTGPLNIPNKPYELSSEVRFVKNGMKLSDTKLTFEGIKLSTNGLLNFKDQLLGSYFDFEVKHDNVSSLSRFEIIGDSLSFLIPGQSLQTKGRLSFEDDNWKVSDLSGLLGTTNVELDAMISKKQGLAGSQVQFSIEGPDLHSLIKDQGNDTLPSGAFSAKGQVLLSDTSLQLKKIRVHSSRAHGDVDFDLGWPVTDILNVGFNIDIEGNDINRLIPQLNSIEFESLNFKLLTKGKVKDNLISLEKFEAEIGNLVLTITGQLTDHPTDQNVNLNISALSSDVSSLVKVNGNTLPNVPLNLKAVFSGNAREFEIQEIQASLGDSKLDAFLGVSLMQPRPSFKLVANSDYIDIAPFEAVDEAGEADEAEQGEQEATSKSDRLIPETPLPLEVLNTININTKINIKHLRNTKTTLKDLVIDVDLQSGNLQFHQLSLEAPRGKLNASMSVIPKTDQFADIKLDLSASQIFFNISGLNRDQLKKVPTYDVEIHTTGGGSTIRDLAGSINGYVSVKSTGGLLEGLDLSLLDSFILDDIFGLLMPNEKSKDTTVTCLATIIDIKDGLMKTSPALAFTTDRITVITKGSLDLKTEKMHFNFNATPNNALQISAGELFNPYILVSGTLAKPGVGIDPGKALIHGGAAIGTAGISILAKGLIDRVGNAVPLCDQMLKTPAGAPKSKKK